MPSRHHEQERVMSSRHAQKVWEKQAEMRDKVASSVISTIKSGHWRNKNLHESAAPYGTGGAEGVIKPGKIIQGRVPARPEALRSSVPDCRDASDITRRCERRKLPSSSVRLKSFTCSSIGGAALSTHMRYFYLAREEVRKFLRRSHERNVGDRPGV